MGTSHWNSILIVNIIFTILQVAFCEDSTESALEVSDADSNLISETTIEPPITTTTTIPTTTPPPPPLKNITDRGRDAIFAAGVLSDVDLTLIPGWRDSEESWVPSLDIQRDLPAYLSGFDNQSIPIWALEWGRYSWGKYLRGGKMKTELLKKYVRHLAYLCLKSQALRSTTEHPVHQHYRIIDMQGFNPDFLRDRIVFEFFLHQSRNYKEYIDRYIARIIVINMNAVSEIFLNGIRSFIRHYSGKLDIYGTNKYEWGPKLAKRFPVNQLPEWYGGSKDFKPIYVIG